jgi:hypothetical protein
VSKQREQLKSAREGLLEGGQQQRKWVGALAPFVQDLLDCAKLFTQQKVGNTDGELKGYR